MPTDVDRQSSPDDEVDEKKEERNRVVWNRTEDLLRSAEADILQIFDWYAHVPAAPKHLLTV